MRSVFADQTLFTLQVSRSLEMTERSVRSYIGEEHWEMLVKLAAVDRLHTARKLRDMISKAYREDPDRQAARHAAMFKTLNDPDHAGVEDLALAITAAADEKIRDAIPQLIDLLRHKEESIRKKSAWALERIFKS